MLSFGPYDYDERQSLERSSTLWSSVGVLDTVTLDSISPVQTILPLLTARLVRLRLCPPYDHLQKNNLRSLADALLASPPCLQLVKEIVVPTLNELATPEDEVTTRSSVAELCSAREIELVDRLAFPAMDWMAVLEDALDAW